MKPGKLKSKKRKRIISSDTDQSAPSASSTEEILWRFLRENKQAIIKELNIPDDYQDLQQHANSLEADIARQQDEIIDLKKRLAIAEGRMTRTEKLVSDVQSKTTELTTRSMRDNLQFKNIAETRGETQAILEQKITFLLEATSVVTKLNMKTSHLTGPSVGHDLEIIAPYLLEYWTLSQ